MKGVGVWLLLGPDPEVEGLEGERLAAVELSQEIEDGGRTGDLLHSGGRLPRVLYPIGIPVGVGPNAGERPSRSLTRRTSVRLGACGAA